MAFGSMSFLFGFLPLTLLCYFLMPRRWRSGRNLVLLLFSLAFYCWGGVRLLPAFAVSCVGNWAAALLSAPGRRHRKAVYAAAVVFNVLMLGYYKYTGFLLGNLAALGMDVTVPSIALPAGISFFTFQAGGLPDGRLPGRHPGGAEPGAGHAVHGVFPPAAPGSHPALWGVRAGNPPAAGNCR